MSSSLNKVVSPILGAASDFGKQLTSMQDTSAYENLINYYNNLDTSLEDDSMKNLGNAALNLSGNLTDYISSVDGSDAAREEAQNAVWNSYQSLLAPTHETETNDLQTRLLNQGLTVGSEAYERAMGDLQQKQNLALNQAAYQAVSAGNEAFNSSFQQALNNAKLNNQARKDSLDEIYKYTKESMSERDKQEKMFELTNELNKINAQNEAAGIQALLSLMGAVI